MRKKYSEMTKAEKRVAIAKDVLKQLDVKRYIAEEGSYITDIRPVDVALDADIKKNFSKIKNCRVCALGACLLSITKFENKLKFEDVGGGMRSFDKHKAKKLLTLFSPSQLMLIEQSFEGFRTRADRFAKDLFGFSPYKQAHLENKIDHFHDTFEDDERLIAIMKNIIKNKGTFVLPK